MLAVEISSYGAPQVLRAVERPTPELGSHEVLVEVAAAGVARADTLQRQGKYPPPPGASDIPGLDISGTVVQTGSAVSRWKPGDRVCAILAGGGYAQLCAVPEPQILPIPEAWTDVEAATLPENLFTVYDNLITRAQLAPGETVLIHGGTSGIGSTAIMLARAIGAVPVATAGSEAKCEACRYLGAELAIDYRAADFVAETQRFTAGRGVDVVLDIVGGPYLERNIKALATDGRITVVSVQGGSQATLDMAQLMHKRARVMGSTMRVRTPEQKGQVAQRLYENIWPLLRAKNTIRPVIDSTFPLAEAWRAHERMESSEHIGKILLIP